MRAGLVSCPRKIQTDKIGISVLASKYDATIEKPTASESGTNIAFAAPTMKNDGTNTASTQSIAMRSGSATSIPESLTARGTDFSRARCV